MVGVPKAFISGSPPRTLASAPSAITTNCRPVRAAAERPMIHSGAPSPRERSGRKWTMETPLTPLEFARRTRRLHPEREAVTDGDQRFSYEQFFDRCDRWSSALQRLGVRPGDRVVYIAPNTHALLEGFYAVPQLGAVLVDRK